jgi:hypothetical protein
VRHSATYSSCAKAAKRSAPDDLATFYAAAKSAPEPAVEHAVLGGTPVVAVVVAAGALWFLASVNH